ncbi:Mg2+ transporter protein CorA-like/Zinc transport protein ZntB [Apiospora aurea]|uniref:Mg2+ transporter protein CorA-like/Zinc transport protein ZntB n=1 Tax=Apiospora aurea TaxID=335848 RepID=A0ABR1QPC4_9PEZI
MSESAPNAYLPWRKEDVPEETSAEFQGLLTLTSRSSFESKGYSWKDAPNPETWCAFGDEGTTALVGAYGDLIQFGTYTGCGQSGMFTADRRASDEPYWVTSRTKQLQDWAEGGDNFETHYGLQVYQVSSESTDGPRRILPPSERPELQWVNYRWPRFTASDKIEDNKSTVETTTQWVAHDGLILQQTQLRYSGQESIHLQCRLPSGDDALDIRDLDHVDAYYSLYVKYKQVFGPHRYSWVFVRELDPQEPRTTNESGQKGWEDSIAVVASIMQDGNLIQWKVPPEAPPASSQASTITAETPGQIWDITLEADCSTEIVIAYKMALVPKWQFHTWDSFIIPADAMDVSTILSGEIPCPDTLRLYDITRIDSSRAQPRSLPATPQDASEHIEFVVHRHLEHILSNCSIPLTPRTIRSGMPETTLPESREAQLTEGRLVPVALTCGDVSFHRVSGSSSL